MAISYVRVGGTAGSADTAFIPYPTAPAPTSGNLLLLMVANKHDEHTVSTPSGWTAPSNNSFTGGVGTEGTEDEGTARITVFYKISNGAESGSQSVTATSGNSIAGFIAEFSRSAGDGWEVACAGGSDNSAGTSWSAAMGSDPGISVGDLLVAVSGINTNLYTYSSPAFTASGATFTGTYRSGASSTSGANCRANFSTITVDTGPATAAGTYTITASGSSTNNPAGATVLVRLRETSSASLTDVDTDETITAGQASVAYTGTGLTNADGLMVQTGTKEAAATSFSATNATSGTFTAPTAAAIRTAGVKFGSCTFSIEDGGVALATLAGTINPSSGLTVHNVSDISQAADTGCIYYGQSPSVAVGDQILFASTTTSNGWAVTIDAQGFVTVDSAGNSSQDSFTYYIFDATDESWGTAGTWTINESNSVRGSIRTAIRSAVQSAVQTVH